MSSLATDLTDHAHISPQLKCAYDCHSNILRNSVAITEPGQVAAQVAAEHRCIGQVFVGPNNSAVRARNMGHRTVRRQTAGALRESAERARGSGIIRRQVKLYRSVSIPA